MAQLRGRRGVVGVQFSHSRGLSGLLSCLTMCQFFRGLVCLLYGWLVKFLKAKTLRETFSCM